MLLDQDAVADERDGISLAGAAPGSATAIASIDTVPTTGARSPATTTSVPVMSRRNPSA